MTPDLALILLRSGQMSIMDYMQRARENGWPFPYRFISADERPTASSDEAPPALPPVLPVVGGATIPIPMPDAIAAIKRENKRIRARHSKLLAKNRAAVKATLVAVDAQIAGRAAAVEAGFRPPIDHWADRLLKQALERLERTRWVEKDRRDEDDGDWTR